MSRKYLAHVDLNKLQLQNALLHPLASAPSSPGVGQVYTNTATGTAYVWSGAAWRPTDAAQLTDGSIQISALATNPLSRANHTGTQLSSTISDLATTVKAYKLSDFAAPSANIPMAGFTLTGLATPTAAGHAAEYSWVQAQIQASAAGIDNKPSVVALAASNIASLSGLPTVDGVAMTAGQRLLLVGQTAATQNGVYVVAAGAWTRDVDIITPQAFWLVEQGTTYGGSQWKVSTTGTITLGTTSLSIVQFGAGSAYSAGYGLTLTGASFAVNAKAGGGIVSDSTGVYLDAAVAARKYAATIGDGSSVSIAVAHGLGTQDITVSIRDASTNQAYEADWTATGTSVVTFNFPTAPAANSLRVVVHG
ncbi:hypothetical protein [Aquitalea magnusonii]|uniref:Uncharacterized protein n=1 Tax=Aquitalea magnusonii TaxID=332411 RepID=A0A318JMQ6_9NEIS|nr:hypothetical protein [Aquitalea magnusonii]PXX48992.1 hypothetical protein DFR38_10528 [Aquitalea magnusonii]